jgi:GNAT superfamily N-acetyltransferase
MKNHTVRSAGIDDLDTLVSFTLAEALEAEGSNKSSERVHEGIKTALADPAIASYWVLENSDGELIGSVSVVKEWSDWHAGFYWWIQSMFIQPEYRGQQLMSLLLDKVRQEAEDEDALEVRLYVHNDNFRAIRAYEREGFSISPYKIMVMPL